jgi:hypothetical protein
MGAMCEGPCGVGPCDTLVFIAVTPILLVLGLIVLVVPSVPTILVRLIDPPPRAVLSF